MNPSSPPPASAPRPRKIEHPARSLAESVLFQSVARPLERATFDSARRAGAWLGLAFFGALGKRRAIAIANLRRAFPHLSHAQANRLARRSVQNLSMTFCEFLHQRVASPQEIRGAASLDGLEHIESALERGRGCILMTAHLGNWEMMGARVAQEVPLWAVARETSNPRIEAGIRAARQAAGIHVLSKYDSAREVLSGLKGNRALVILPDQHAGPSAPLMPLFGAPTRVVDAPFRIAQIARAPIVPVYGVRRTPWLSDGRISCRISPAFDVPRDGNREAHVLDATRRGLDELEAIVRAFPDQWLWLHKRWRPEDEAAGEQSSEQNSDRARASSSTSSGASA
jgi:KDO2-lipid IV(A) lauroyltransferase